MVYDIVNTHVSEIKNGDCIIENGVIVTISRNHIKADAFLGVTIRGDSYNCGRKPVMRVVIKRNVNGVWLTHDESIAN